MKNDYIFKNLSGIFLILFISILNLNAQNIEVLATGLTGINGLSLDDSGNLWITQSGTGNDDARVSVMTPDKQIYEAITGLPSFYDTLEGDAPGAWKAYHNGNNLQVIVGGGPNPNAGSLISFDISNWKPGDSALSLANATEITHINNYLLTQGITDSDPYRVCWDANGNDIIVDAAANSILKKDAITGQLSILHSFPPIPNSFTPFPPVIDYVPTSIVKNPLGGYYICNLTGFPFIPGLASIVKMDDSGNVSAFVNGLSLLTDLDIDPKGNLYALQLGQFDTAFNPILFAPKIIRITPDGVVSDFALGFTPVLCSGFVLDGNGGFYANDFGIGQLIHVSYPTETKSINNTNPFNCYLSPNPVSSSTEINFTLSSQSTVEISILDQMGHAVKSIHLGDMASGKHNATLNLSDFHCGLYYVQLKMNSSFTTLKLEKL